MRLQRVLARAGVASRRHAEDLIREGRVKVNGEVGELGMRVDPDVDIIFFGNRRVRVAPVTWLAFHKPVGTVVSRSDERGRPTIFALLPDHRALTYVGRLDFMTSGLLLLTTDGVGVNRLTHPRFGVERVYLATVRGGSPRAITQLIGRGVSVDGRPVAIVDAETRRAGRGRVELELTLAEGRYRIVRRLCSELGLTVERLKRVRYGPVRLGKLPVGTSRPLSKRELTLVTALANANGN